MEQDERDTRGEEVLGDIGGRRIERRRLERFSQGETRGSVEGLVWHQNCCGFSCKTDGELFLVRCQLGGDNNGFYFRELIEDAEDAAETAKGGSRKELGEHGAGSRGQRFG